MNWAALLAAVAGSAIGTSLGWLVLGFLLMRAFRKGAAETTATPAAPAQPAGGLRLVENDADGSAS